MIVRPIATFALLALSLAAELCPAQVNLTVIPTPFNEMIGIDHHEPSNQVLVTVNYPTGNPYNFELVDSLGARSSFSAISGLTDELKIATARSDGGGVSLGGFAPGEAFTGSGVPGVVVRISPDGTTVQNPWVTLPGESGLMRGGLYVDRTGVWNGDLIVVTTAGGVWRITEAGTPTRVATIPTHLEGVITVPDDVRYGPWAGKILCGAEQETRFYTVDVAGTVTPFSLGIQPEDIEIVPVNQNFFGVDYSGKRLWGAPPSEFISMVGDFIVAQESGQLWHVRWNGSAFERTVVAQVPQWEHVTFSPAGIIVVPPADPCSIDCPDDIVAFADAASCDAPVTFQVTASSGCALDPITCSPPSGSSFPVGTTLVSCFAVDSLGERAACEFTVTVEDTTPPEILCNAHDIAPIGGCGSGSSGRSRPGSGSADEASPLVFVAGADDACPGTIVRILDSRCAAPAGSGSGEPCECEVAIDGDSITILRSGRPGTIIRWTVQAIDASGNEATRECEIRVLAPAHSGSAGSSRSTPARSRRSR